MVWQSNLPDLPLHFTTRDWGVNCMAGCTAHKSPGKHQKTFHTSIMRQSEGENFYAVPSG
jgi:hypothetical protein